MQEWMDAEMFAERAAERYEQGDFAGALKDIDAALRIQPDQSDWLHNKATALEAIGEFRLAADCYESLLQIEENNLDVILRLAALYNRLVVPERALHWLEIARDQAPRHESCYCHAIASHTLLGEHDLAEQAFYMARQLKDECPTCYDHLAESLAMRGDLTRAIWCWEQTLRLDPSHTDVRAKLANAHWRLGRVKLARQQFIDQLRLDPGDMEAFIDLAKLDFELKDHDAAIARLNYALELEPDHLDAQLALVDMLLECEQFTQCGKVLSATARQHRGQAEVLLRVAQLAYQEDRLQDSRRAARLAMRDAALPSPQMLILANLLLDLKLPRHALKLFDRVLIRQYLEPAHQHGLFQSLMGRGRAHMMLREYDAAITSLRRAVRTEPRNLSALQALHDCLINAGQMKRAATILRSCQRMDPLHPATRLMQWKHRQGLVSSWMTRLSTMLAW